MSAKSNPGTLTLFASAARTASATGDPFRIQGDSYRGLVVQIDATAAAATPSVVFTVQGHNGTTWTTHLASAAVTAVGTTNLIVHPDAADTANVSESTTLPKAWRVIATAGDADSLTYSVKAWVLR